LRSDDHHIAHGKRHPSNHNGSGCMGYGRTAKS
jgi:hypothetical protein